MALRKHRPQLAILLGLAAALSVAASACGPAAPTTAQGQEPSVVAVRVATAGKTTLTSSLDYTGDIKARYQVQLAPKISGRLQEINVDIGSRIEAGEVIARLETDTLEAQAEQAQAGLAGAAAKLSSMQSGSRAENVAIAQANLDAAIKKLDLLRAGTRPEDLASAQAAIDAARAKLDQMQSGGRAEQVAQAEAGVAAAQARLDAGRIGARGQDVAAATAAVEQARANYSKTAANLATAKELASSAVDTAANTLRAAQTAYSKAWWDWDIVQRTNKAPELADKTGVKPPDLTTYEKQRYKDALDQAQRAMQDAERGLDAARVRYEQAKKDEVDGLHGAQGAVDQARAALDKLRAGSTNEDLRQLEAALAQAQAQLGLAQQPATEQDITQAQAAVRQAEETYNKLLQPVRPQELGQAQDAVTVARQQLALAQQPYTEDDLKAAEASVAAAQAQANAAQLQVDQGQISSPVSGVVAERLVAAGALVSPQTPMLTLISPDVELTIAVEESQIGKVSLGQTARLQVAAFPGQSFSGKVSAVAPSADQRTRTFAVKIVPDPTDGRLKAGMFAQVSLVVGERTDVLVVPREAVVERSGRTLVFVIDGNRALARPVKVGAAGGDQTEIVSGINPGDQVAVAGLSALEDGTQVSVSK